MIVSNYLPPEALSSLLPILRLSQIPFRTWPMMNIFPKYQQLPLNSEYKQIWEQLLFVHAKKFYIAGPLFIIG